METTIPTYTNTPLPLISFTWLRQVHYHCLNLNHYTNIVGDAVETCLLCVYHRTFAFTHLQPVISLAYVDPISYLIKFTYQTALIHPLTALAKVGLKVSV